MASVGQHPNSLKNLVSQRDTPGRPKGHYTKHKMTQRLREDIFNTYKDLSGEDGMGYLSVLATEYPQVFTSLLAKLIPQEIRAEIGRPGDFDQMTTEELERTALSKLLTLLPLKEFKKIEPYIKGLTGNKSGLEDGQGIGTETVVAEPDPVHEENLCELPDSQPPPIDSRNIGEGGTG